MRNNPFYQYLLENGELVGTEKKSYFLLPLTTSPQAVAAHQLPIDEQHIRIDHQIDERIFYLSPYHYTARIQIASEVCVYHAYFNLENQYICYALRSAAKGEVVQVDSSLLRELSSHALQQIEHTIKGPFLNWKNQLSQLEKKALALGNQLDDSSFLFFSTRDNDQRKTQWPDYRAALHQYRDNLLQQSKFSVKDYSNQLRLLRRIQIQAELLLQDKPRADELITDGDTEIKSPTPHSVTSVKTKADEPKQSLSEIIASLRDKYDAYCLQYQALYNQQKKPKNFSKKRPQLLQKMLSVFKKARDAREEALAQDNHQAALAYVTANRIYYRLLVKGQEILCNQLKDNIAPDDAFQEFANIPGEKIFEFISNDNKFALNYLFTFAPNLNINTLHPDTGYPLLLQCFYSSATSCFDFLLHHPELDLLQSCPNRLPLAYVILQINESLTATQRAFQAQLRNHVCRKKDLVDNLTEKLTPCLSENSDKQEIANMAQFLKDIEKSNSLGGGLLFAPSTEREFATMSNSLQNPDLTHLLSEARQDASYVRLEEQLAEKMNTFKSLFSKRSCALCISKAVKFFNNSRPNDKKHTAPVSDTEEKKQSTQSVIQATVDYLNFYDSLIIFRQLQIQLGIRLPGEAGQRQTKGAQRFFRIKASQDQMNTFANLRKEILASKYAYVSMMETAVGYQCTLDPLVAYMLQIEETQTVDSKDLPTRPLSTALS